MSRECLLRPSASGRVRTEQHSFADRREIGRRWSLSDGLRIGCLPSVALAGDCRHNFAMHRNVAKGRTRRLVGLAVVVLLTCMVLSSCESGRVGARCRGTGWGDDGGAWILRCQKGRWVRALTKHDYAKIVLASQPAPTAPPTTGAPATSPPTTAPPTAPAPLGGIGSVVSGGSFVCAVTAERQVRCWGYNTDGGLASGPVNSTFRPLASLVPGVANVLELTAGAGHSGVPGSGV